MEMARSALHGELVGARIEVDRLRASRLATQKAIQQSRRSLAETTALLGDLQRNYCSEAREREVYPTLFRPLALDRPKSVMKGNAPMFDPREILNPSDHLLEAEGPPMKAGLTTASTPLLWLMGALLFSAATWAIFRTSDTGEQALESGPAHEQSTERAAQSASRQHASDSATTETPALAAGDYLMREQGASRDPGSTSFEDRLEPINPIALGTPHAIVPAQTSSETFRPEEQQGRSPSIERVRVASAADIHSGPSSSYVLLGTAQVGAEAEVASRDADWVEIRDPASGKVGWINSKHVAPLVAEEGPTESNGVVTGDQQAAVADEEEAIPAPPPKKRSLKAKKKSYKGWRKKRRGFALRFAFRRLR